MKLYEITTALAGLDDEAGEFSPQALADTLDGLTMALTEKAHNIARLRQNWLADEKAIDTEIKRLQALKKIRKNRREALEDYLRHNMSKAGIQKIEAPDFSITLGKPSEAVQVEDVEALPESMVRIQRAPDKAAIKAAIKSGVPVPGAALVEGKPRLIIK